MTLRLNGSSSGHTEIKAPAAAGDNTITLPTSNGSAEQFVKNSGTAGELEFSSMVEDSSGRLLVGTSSSRSAASLSSHLQVEGTGGDDSTISVTRNSDSAGPPRIVLGTSRGTAVGSSTVVQSGDSVGEISFAGADGTDLNSVAATILCQVDGTPGSNDMPGRLMFSTTADGASSPTERLRITKDGHISIVADSKKLIVGAGDDLEIVHDGTDSKVENVNTSSTLHLGGGGSTGGQIDLYASSHGSNSKEIHMHTNSEHRVKVSQTGAFTIHPDSYGFGVRSQNASNSTIEAFFVAHSSTNHDNGTIVYANYLNGNVVNANNSYGQLSDERLKENIIDAPSQWDDIKSLRVRKYNFREDTGYESHTQIGLVAQEAETVCPGLVQENLVKEGDVVLDGDGNQLESTKRVISSVLYMKAVKALQEAQTRIETLETQNTAQQTQIDDLLARVTALEAA